MTLIDSHIHLDFPQFDGDRAALMHGAQTAGISAQIVPATGIANWQKIAEVCEQVPNTYAAYGLHPYFISQHQLAHLDALEAFLATHDAVAVGEIGLDYYRKDLDRDKQIQFFEAQVDIALRHGLPVIIHARKATEGVINTLKTRPIVSGIVHSFNGSHEQALRLIDLGFLLGFGGAITRSRALRLRKLVKQLPLDYLCLETDAPDQPIAGFSGGRNEPLALIEVAKTVSALKKQSIEEIASVTTQNIQRVFDTIRP